MFGDMLENVRRRRPLIHCITNYVTINDCANVLLACGASPIMADEEAEEITAACDGLVLNLGTLSRRRIPAMLAAGRRAGELGHPVILDPVGAGASALRTDTARRILDELRVSVVRCNLSEMRALYLGTESRRGVDADLTDRVTEENLNRTADAVRAFAGQTGAVAAVTGAIDIVADAGQAYCIRNGDPMMSRVTGVGCQLSALTAAFAAANPGRTPEAAAAAVCAMGLCGQTARGRMTERDGSGSYRTYLMDAVYLLTPEALDAGADCTIL